MHEKQKNALKLLIIIYSSFETHNFWGMSEDRISIAQIRRYEDVIENKIKVG